MNPVSALRIVAAFLLRRLVPALLAVALPHAAGACAVLASHYDMEAYADADVIIRAKVVGYRLDETGLAHFDLETVETLETVRSLIRLEKGAILRDVLWQNSTFKTPDIWKTEAILVGVVALIDKSGAVQLRLVQQGCNPRFILKDSAKNRELLAAAFSRRTSVVLTRDQENARAIKNSLASIRPRLKFLINTQAQTDPQRIKEELRKTYAELERLFIAVDPRPEPAEQ